MEQIYNIINDTNSNVRVYLLKKQGNKRQYDAVIFPNEINNKIKETYSKNFVNFCEGRDITEYDSVHSEKNSIKKLPLSELSCWENILNAMSTADRNCSLLTKENFTDNYSAIVLVCEKTVDEEIQKVYILAQYRKIDSWYKKSVKFGFVANTIQYKDEEIFVLNGCIDTVIVDSDVFVLHETAFEKIFNYFEKLKKNRCGQKERNRKLAVS